MDGSTRCSKCKKWRNNRQMMLVEVYTPVAWAHIFYELCRDCYAGYSKLVLDYIEKEGE